MNDGLNAERILVAAEDTLRRFGPGKATVVDVARVLGVSHASVYRHFASKAALRDAVLSRWLHRVSGPLATIASDRSRPAAERLWLWFDGLRAAKRLASRSDPELFATYAALALESRDVVAAHVRELTLQLGAIVAAGTAEGDFRAGDPAAIARAAFLATSAFHHPAHAPAWGTTQDESDYAGVRALLAASLARSP